MTVSKLFLFQKNVAINSLAQVKKKLEGALEDGGLFFLVLELGATQLVTTRKESLSALPPCD